MENRIFIFKAVGYKNGFDNAPTSEFYAAVLSTDQATAESEVREVIIDSSDGEIGPFKTTLILDFNENEVGIFDK